MIDTHAHLYLEQFRSDLDQVLESAKETGVEQILMPNVDHSTIDDMMEVEERFPLHCTPMMGLHPCSVNQHFERELYLVEEWLEKRPFIAIGEIGTDLYWDKTTFKYQQEAFSVQVNWACKKALPVVIHCRDSMDETLDLLEPLVTETSKGVFHCFTGDKQQADRIIALGFKMGIGGVVTFKNSGLDQTLEEVPLEHLILETDSPYLAPVPFRGKRNQPAYLTHIVHKLSEVYQTSTLEIQEITSQTARSLFQLIP